MVPPPDDGTISSLLEAALAAASDDLQWPAFLEALSSQLQASTMSLFLSDPVGQRSSIQFAAGKDPSYVKAYNEHFATVSPFFGDWSHERWREGVIELSGQVCPDRVLLRTEYYNDWLRPQRIHHLARGVVAREGEASWVLSFGRPRRSGSITGRELALFGAILPGLRGALRLRHHLLVARSERDAASAAFDALRIGVIFLDGRDSPIGINRRAQAILDAADGLKLERGTLSASCSTDTARLRRLIGQVREAIHTGGGMVAINRPSGREPLHAVVTPLPRNHFYSGPRGSHERGLRHGAGTGLAHRSRGGAGSVRADARRGRGGRGAGTGSDAPTDRSRAPRKHPYGAYPDEIRPLENRRGAPGRARSPGPARSGGPGPAQLSVAGRPRSGREPSFSQSRSNPLERDRDSLDAQGAARVGGCSRTEHGQLPARPLLEHTQ